MIQNAEDADAKSISFILINTPVKTSNKFFTSELLISINDAQVTEEDWKGIRSIGISKKKNDPYMVGKFGLGMKSLFHISGNSTQINI